MKTRYHGSRCEFCKHYPCSKTPTPGQDYCGFVPPQFERKT